MGDLPLHPALVHVPVGVAFVMPVIAAAVAWSVLSGRCHVRAWLLVVALQAVVLGFAIAAIQTGEDEGERVEHRVSEALIETHEERAEAFAWASGVGLAFAGLAFALKGDRARRAMLGLTVLTTLVVAGLGAATGHAGGTIVHGPQGLVQSGGALPAAGEHGGEDDD